MNGPHAGWPGGQRLLLVCTALLVALAGCSGFEGPDGTAPTPAPTATATSSPEERWQSGPRIGTPEIRPVNTDPGEVVGPAVETLRAVDAYRVSGTVDVTVAGADGNQPTRGVVTTSVNRTAMQLRTTSSLGQDGRTEAYLVDGVVYRRDPGSVATRGTEWVVESSTDPAAWFNRHDELGAHRVMLEHATADVVGTQQVSGGYAYRLALDVDVAALNDFYGFDDRRGVDRVEATVWIRPSTDRLVRAAGTVHRPMVVDGRTVDATVEYEKSFSYTSVTISLPAAADSAVAVNATAGT